MADDNPALELAAFRGLRYAVEDPGALLDTPVLDLALALAPPYDVVSAAAAREMMRRSPHSAVNVTVPIAWTEAAARSGTDPAPYRRAARTLRQWITDGSLARDPVPLLYAYEQVTPDGRHQRGLIGALRLPEDAGAAVRPHEDVTAGPVQDRVELMAATRANPEPVFLVYRGGRGEHRGAATLATDSARDSEPLVDTHTSDGTAHRLWAIADPGVHADIAADLAGRTALIADGHHRYAAYLRLRREHPGPGPFDFGLAYLLDSDATPPRLGAIHRVLPGLDAEEAARRAGAVARVKAVAEGTSLEAAVKRLGAAQRPALLLGGAGSRYLIDGFSADALAEAMPDRSPEWRQLPTAALRHLLLPLWGASEDGGAARLVHDDAAAALATARETGGAAVLLPPLDVDEVYAVTARGELLPPKSTSFGPKPRSGLVLRTLD